MAHGSARAIRLGAELADPMTQARAITEIVKAFDAVGGNAVHAAERLETGHRTVMVWMKRFPELQEAVRKVREKHGHPHEMGTR